MANQVPWLAAAVVLLGWTPAMLAASDTTVHVDEAHPLLQALLDITQSRLQPSGLAIDRSRAQMALSGGAFSSGDFNVRPRWRVDDGVPVLPLVFDLLPIGEDGRGMRTAFLSVAFMQDVAVSKRRLSKGSAVSCDDVGVERRALSATPKRPLLLPCRIGEGVVARRELARGDALRENDVGAPPDVTAGAMVSIDASTGGINVTTLAIALSDAQRGDIVNVRLERPRRTLRTRVTGVAKVQLLDVPLQ